MLTLFTIPKAFHGHIAVIQRNAILSWTHLDPRPEIILFGSDAGTAELAAELGLRHEPNVAVTDRGTPLVNDLFAKAEAAATFDRLAYVNADIILTQDFLRAVALVERLKPRSLMVSKRIDLDVREPLEFGRSWQQDLQQRVRASGVDGHHSSIDIFVYPKGLYSEIPPFAIGRLWWDHWLIKAVHEQNLPVLDASRIAPLVHQRHDYNHAPGGEQEVWRGAEAQKNFELSGGVRHAYTLLSATHVVTEAGTIRRTFLREPAHAVRTFLWEVLVHRTHKLRKRLGLTRSARA